MLVPTLNLPTITQEVALNTIRFNRNLGFLQGRIAAFGKAMADVGVSISLAVSIPLQLMAGAAIKSFATLEDAASRAASRMTGNFEQIRDSVIRTAQDISRRVPISATEIAQGTEELIKAGAQAKFAEAAIEHLTQAAVAGGLSVDETISRVTDVFFGMALATGKAEEDLLNLRRTTDVISKAADISKASFDDMTAAFVTGAPIAKSFNLELGRNRCIAGRLCASRCERSRCRY
jgi:TP901 family phage tail tape measure protein